MTLDKGEYCCYFHVAVSPSLLQHFISMINCFVHIIIINANKEIKKKVWKIVR